MDYYDVLDVPRDASQAEIRRAYRRKVKEYHPDVSDHPDAADRFRAITRAEEVLGDESERERYDRLGHEGYRRVVEDGVPEEEVDRGPAGPQADDPDERATGGEHATDRAAESARSSRGGSGGSASTRVGQSAEGWQATGPSAGSDNPSQRSYSPWSGEEDGSEDADRGFEDWWADQEYDDSADDGPFAASEDGPFGASDDDPFADDDPFERGSPGASTAERTPSGGTTGGATASGTNTGTVAAETTTSGATTGGEPTPGGTGGGFWTAEVDDAERTPTPGPNVVQRTLQSREATMLTIALLVIYPVFVYFALSPALPTALNALVGVATVTVTVFMLTEPGISLLVFGTWSLLSPLVLTFLGMSLLSLSSLFVLAAFWVPLGLSFVIALAMPSG